MSPARVLVVDDEDMILFLIDLLLKDQGYEVLLARGALEALDHVRTDPFIHLVLSDNNMPQMSGIQLLCEVGRLSPNTAGVLMTGGVPNSAEMPENLPLLKKPFTPQDLISIIRATLPLEPKLAPNPPTQLI